MLSCALIVAERISIPSMLGEGNLTWKSDQLATQARLLSRAGDSRRALDLIEKVAEPDRVIAPGLGQIAIVAIQAGNQALAERMIKRLSSMTAWTAPIALADVSRAIYEAGDVGQAHALATRVADPAARAEVLLEMVRRSQEVSKDEAVRWLSEAQRAAVDIAPGTKPFFLGREGGIDHVADFYQRLAVMLDLAKAFATLGEVERAQRIVAAMAEVEDSKSTIWQAKALLGIAEVLMEGGGARAPERALELTAEARETIDSAVEWVVGDTREKVEVLIEISRLYQRHGKEEQRTAAIAQAATLAERLESIDSPGVRVSVGVEVLARIANAYTALGREKESLEILRKAQALTDDLPIPEPREDSSWDSASSARHSKVKAWSQIAVGLERAGESDGASTLLDRAMSETTLITNPTWRMPAWEAIVGAFVDLGSPERAIEALSAGDRPDPDRLSALAQVAEPLLSADRIDDVAAVLYEMPASWEKVKLLSDVAQRLEQAGRGAEANRRITEALAVVAEKPIGWDRALLLLATESPSSDREANLDQQEIMKSELCGF